MEQRRKEWVSEGEKGGREGGWAREKRELPISPQCKTGGNCKPVIQH